MNNGKVKGRFIICGKLRLESPLVIGTGEKDYLNRDIVVQKDENGLPYIPASSIYGALRHYFCHKLKLEQVDKKKSEYFWGSAKDQSSNEDTLQSAFLIEDLCVINNPVVVVRDGIKIDHRLGIAKDEGKFNYEVVEPGAEFSFKAEVILREVFSKEIFIKIINTLIKALSESQVQLGSMTTKGFGRCRLLDYKLYEYDFEKATDVIVWFKAMRGEALLKEVDFKNIFASSCRRLKLKAIFDIKGSLIVKSYSGLPSKSDAIHISSNGQDIIPGTSLKGAFRARAIKIINTIGSNGKELVKEFFGWAPDNPKGGKKHKSRFIVEDAKIKNALKETQFRTKIDRFTGGVIKSALFDSTPIWGDDKAEVVINCQIDNYQDWEAGLMLLLLKDLWDGDLPLGGEKSIGRGVLKGKLAEIHVEDKQYLLKKDGDHLQFSGNKAELEKFVHAFVEKYACKGAGR